MVVKGRNTGDGRTIRFPDPDIKVGDSVKVKLEDNTISDFFKLDIGARVMVVKGRNTGRIGNVRKIEKHPGATNIVHIDDVSEHKFATRIQNVFVIGTDDSAAIKVPKSAGVKLSIIEEKARREARQQKEAHH